MTEDFIIPLNGLKPGKKSSSWHVGTDLFRDFGNTDILDADLTVEVSVEKSGSYIGIDCDMEGTLTVPCDRCLEDLTLPVSSEIRLSVKFGPEPVSDDEVVVTDEREVIYLPEDSAELDMSQVIYDYACLALPMQRVHGEGACNPDAVKYLTGTGVEVKNEEAQASDSNPFAVLKGLMDNK